MSTSILKLIQILALWPWPNEVFRSAIFPRNYIFSLLYTKEYRVEVKRFYCCQDRIPSRLYTWCLRQLCHHGRNLQAGGEEA